MDNKTVNTITHLFLTQSLPLLIGLGIIIILGIGVIIFGWSKNDQSLFAGGLMFLGMGLCLTTGVMYTSYAIPKNLQTAINHTNGQNRQIELNHKQ